jgi:hypothetical protein
MKGMIGVGQSGEYIATYVPPVLRRISWTAVCAGVGIALLIQFMFSIHSHLHQFLMGVGVGMGTMDHPTHLKTLATVDLRGIIELCWQSLGLIALLIGSSVASRMAEASYRHEGVLHGLLTWGIVMLLTLCLPTIAVGRLIGGTFGAQIATAQTAQTVSQASFGVMTAPYVGIIVAALGGAFGAPRHL